MTADTDTVATPRDSSVRRLLTGRSNFDFIGRSKTWLIVVIVTLVACGAALAIRGLNFSIEFTGGSAFTVESATQSFDADGVREVLADQGITESLIQIVNDGQGAFISTPALEEIGGDQQNNIVESLATLTGADSNAIDVSAVGPRWGAQVTRQAIRGLIAFFVLVSLYIAIRFELRMAAAAFVTLLHDVIVTVGIYALVGFEVSPASTIAFLTILGYSLYDTVVVFDRVVEDTAGIGSTSTRSYGMAANGALNEVLVRSLSTSVTSILPVGSLLFIGANLLGAATLSDLALALFVGMAVGTYSSIIVATPFLVWLKEKEPKLAELKAKVESRRGKTATA